MDHRADHQIARAPVWRLTACTLEAVTTAPHILRARERQAARFDAGEVTSTITVTRVTGETTATTAPYAVTQTISTIYSGAAVVGTGGGRPRPKFTIANDLVAEGEVRVRIPHDAGGQAGDIVTVTSTDQTNLTNATFDVVGAQEGGNWIHRYLWCIRRQDNPNR